MNMEVSGKRFDFLSELCEICQSDQASGFCKDCNEYMCQRCFQNHTTAKPCRNHILSPSEKASDLKPLITHEEKCKVHTTENIRYYCRRHNTVGCGDCLVSQHVGCKAEIIKDLALNFENSSEFKEWLRRMEKCEIENEENTKNVERNIRQNKELIDKALDGIREFRKEINAFIDRTENDIIFEANKRFKDNQILFAQLQQKIAEVSSEIDDIRKQVDTRAHHGEDLFARVIECKSRQTLVQQTVAEIKSRNVIKMYMFQPEQKLKDMLASGIRLGTIKYMENSEKQEATFWPLRFGTEKEQMVESFHSMKKLHTAERKFFPPDPRSVGYDVGKRVRGFRRDEGRIKASPNMGTILSVDPSGWIEVKWDRGGQHRVKVGSVCMYEKFVVKLL